MDSPLCSNRERTTLGAGIILCAGLMTVMAFANFRVAHASRDGARSSSTPVCYWLGNVLVCETTPSSIPDTVTVAVR